MYEEKDERTEEMNGYKSERNGKASVGPEPDRVLKTRVIKYDAPSTAPLGPLGDFPRPAIKASASPS